MIDTLWDESIINGVDTKETPKMLLKKQASDLAVITKQVVQANITTEMEHDGFLHCFDNCSCTKLFNQYGILC
jgi:hypothetical protein